MFDNYSADSVRKLVSKFFTLQWCRDNLVVPLLREESNGYIIIATENFTSLGDIAETIKRKLNKSGNKCCFIEKPSYEIQTILNLAFEERSISGEVISQFDENAVLQALNEISDISDNFISSESNHENEEFLEEEILDLAVEMCEDKVQNAAGAILINSKNNNVSDIHIEPIDNSYFLRVRKDGVLHDFMSLSKKPGIKLVTCFKNMANMDIAERRASQDGKILRKFEGNRLEFRCSTVPCKGGEKMVLRTLKNDLSNLNLDSLIHVESVRDNFRKIINATNGSIFITGPTGSGKSTTIAAVLKEKNTGDINIVTAEDPIEYDFGRGINQSQVNRAKDQRLVTLLRTFLRQDPDVIFIGETRDPETAEAVMDAAETGLLVFTTLNANSSASSLKKLIDMEVPRYQLNSILRGVLAQRLVRRVCSECGTRRAVSKSESIRFGIDEGTPVIFANSLSSEEKSIRKRKNKLCPKCSGIGYAGRIGVYELLEVNRDIQTAIVEGKSINSIEDIAINNNMLTLKEYGLELVKRGLTTYFEIERVLANHYSPTIIRKLIDIFFSLQWCRDNFAVPLKIVREEFSQEDIIVIAIASYTYLGTIAEFIKAKLNESAYSCSFIEISAEEIQEILNMVSSEEKIFPELKQGLSKISQKKLVYDQGESKRNKWIEEDKKKKELEQELEQELEHDIEENEDIKYIPVNKNMYESKEKLLEKIKDLTHQGKHVEAQKLYKKHFQI